MLISQSQSFVLLTSFTSLTSAYFANRSTPGLVTDSSTDLVFDGRIYKNATPAIFDSVNDSPFLTDSAYGANLTWSKVITLPKVPAGSLFDPSMEEAAIEISLSDESIFQPGLAGFNPDTSNRRADLSPNMSIPYSTPANAGYRHVSGIKTLHFSLQNTARSLNYSHSYDLVWMLNSAFNHEQFSLKTGMVNKTGVKDPKSLILVGSDDNAAPLFMTPFVDGWHNFGLVLDFNKNTTQVFYSTALDPMVQATDILPNDLSGAGQYHFGLSKNPYGASYAGINGTQPSGINESIIFNGIWMEDTSAGQVSINIIGFPKGGVNIVNAYKNEMSSNGSTSAPGGKSSSTNGAAGVAVSSFLALVVVALSLGFLV